MSLFKATSPNNLNICRRFKDAPESLGRGVSNLNERDLGYLNSFASAETLSIDILKSLTTRLKLSLYKNVFVFFVTVICHFSLTYCCCRNSCRAGSSRGWSSPAWPGATPSTGPRADPQPAHGCCWSGESEWWHKEWPGKFGQSCCSWIWW